MLFAAGMGIGLVYWGVAEPLLHYRSAPPGIVNGTPEAMAATIEQDTRNFAALVKAIGIQPE